MEESVDIREEACKENEQTLTNLSPAEEATSKDEVEIERFLQEQKSKNTQYKTKSDLNAWQKFCESLSGFDDNAFCILPLHRTDFSEPCTRAQSPFLSPVESHTDCLATSQGSWLPVVLTHLSCFAIGWFGCSQPVTWLLQEVFMGMEQGSSTASHQLLSRWRFLLSVCYANPKGLEVGLHHQLLFLHQVLTLGVTRTGGSIFKLPLSSSRQG